MSNSPKDNELRERIRVRTAITVIGKKRMERESTLKFITSLLPTMKSTTWVSCQAGRQMRREKAEEEKALGSSANIKIKKKFFSKNNEITIYTHIKK